MKRIVLLFLALCLLIPGLAGAEAPDHEHAWGEWTHNNEGGTHTAECAVCGESRTVKCYNTTVTINENRINVCLFCGYAPFGMLSVIPEAKATPVENDSKAQHGVFVARGIEKPFGEKEPDILYAFTIAYCLDGGLATFKNKSVVSLPLKLDLPEGFKLEKVSVSSGDDSTQRKEEWIDTDYTYEDGVLSFISKSSTLYLIIH